MSTSTDETVTKDLVETLEDGEDGEGGEEGFRQGAEKLDDTDSPELALTFREFSGQRTSFSAELRDLAANYGDQVDDSGTVAAAVHRGWMGLKDALSGSDPKGVLDAAEQGEDHAIKEYRKALDADISAGLRNVVERQARDVKAAHDRVRAMRDAHS